MSSFSETDCKPVRLMCSRRAQHTYEVTFSRQPEVGNLNYSSRVTEVLRRLEEKRKGKAFSRPLPAATGDAASAEVSRKQLLYRDFGERPDGRASYLPEGGDDASPHPDPVGSGYYEACHRRYGSAADAAETEPEPATAAAAYSAPFSYLKSARSKLIQFLQTEEFFDEYSFIALMTLMLAHMFRLSHAIFEMGCTAQTILGVFVYVWRFMQARVGEILTTVSGPQAAYKCATFCAELVVIFSCILLFLWAVFIPACGLILNIISKIFYLCS